MNTLELYSKLFPNFKVTHMHIRYISPVYILSPDALRFNKFVIKIIFLEEFYTCAECNKLFKAYTFIYNFLILQGNNIIRLAQDHEYKCMHL